MSRTEPVSDSLAAILSTCSRSQDWAEQDEGPYHRDAQPMRRDIVEDRDGRSLQLGIRLASGDGTPVRDAPVEIWQCDALGRYSGFQPPDDSVVVTAATAVPLGVGAAVYLEEYAPRNLLTALVEINLTNLAGMPSIVFGLMALGIFVFEFGLGRSIMTAGLTLALLILPIVIVTAREALRTVPDSLREAAYACGASPWQTVRDHVVPAAAPGILTGVIIGLARAIGETAPLIAVGALTFVSFLPESPIRDDFPYISFDWLDAPFTALPVQLFNWTTRPDPAFHANAAAAAFVLVAMALAINGLAIWLRHRLRRETRW